MLPHFSGKLRLQEAKGLAVTQPGDKSRALLLRKPYRVKGEEAMALPPIGGWAPQICIQVTEFPRASVFPSLKQVWQKLTSGLESRDLLPDQHFSATVTSTPGATQHECDISGCHLAGTECHRWRLGTLLTFHSTQDGPPTKNSPASCWGQDLM